MRTLKLYFDTSIFSFALAGDVPKEKDVTLRLLAQVRAGTYEAFVSEVVILEVNRAEEGLAARLRSLIIAVRPEELSVDESSQTLAKRYVEHGIIPERYENDALHIAIASVNDLDVIVSWNFAHIVRFKTKKEVSAVNALMGYRPIEIYSPWEVVENG